jgi:hypothetical protein
VPPQANDAKCGLGCHTIVKTRDYVFTDYGTLNGKTIVMTAVRSDGACSTTAPNSLLLLGAGTP